MGLRPPRRQVDQAAWSIPQATNAGWRRNILGSRSAEPARPAPDRPRKKAAEGSGYAVAATIVAAVTLVARMFFSREYLADVVMLYLLGVVVASLRLGPRASLLAAALSVLAFDFMFIPPYLTFTVADARHVVTFGVMFLVAVVISHLTRRIRDQAAAARERERRTAALYDMSRDLGQAIEREALVSSAADHIGRAFDSTTAVFGPEGGTLTTVHHSGLEPLTGEDLAVAGWVWTTGRPAGLGTDTVPAAGGLYLPLVTSHGRLGVVGVFPTDRGRFDDHEERRFLDAFVAQMAVAVERTVLSEETERARLASERERLRNALLSSVSHDLRTPLAAIEGAASTLLDEAAVLDEPTRRELAETVHQEARRLSRRVRNLLDMTRLEAGAVILNREWQPLEEVVGSALARLDDALAGREVRTALPEALPLVSLDAILAEQVLVNLLENAIKYSPPGSPLEIGAEARSGAVIAWVSDRGPGIPPGEEMRIFEKFYRAAPDRRADGVGLGLTISRAIVAAHGGRIWVEARPGGGARFCFSLAAGSEGLDAAVVAPEAALADPGPSE